MPPAMSIIDRLTPGPAITGVLVALGLGITGIAWHLTDTNEVAATHAYRAARDMRQTTLHQRQQWRALAAQVASYGQQPARSINTTVPLALGAFERAAVTCDAPLSSLTSTAQGAMYALNPGHVAQTVPWAPGTRTVTFVAQGQWHTLSGLRCLLRSLRHRPVALGALDVNATAYTMALEVFGDR